MINKITALASEFRKAIEICNKNYLPITLRSFPKGSCGDAVLLLAKYLEDNGFGKFNYVVGERAGKSHAWLQNKDLIVDITADQFNDNKFSIIVTIDNSWHSSFNGESLHVADFNIYDEYTKSMLRNAYVHIVREIGT